MYIKRKVASVGRERDIEANIELLEAIRRADNDARRFKIAVAVLTGIVLGSIGLGWYALYIDDLKAITAFSIAAAPVFGRIIWYYFGNRGDDP